MNNVSLQKIKPKWYLLAGIFTLAFSHFTHGVSLIAWVAYTPFLIFLNKTNGIRSILWILLALIIGWSIATAKIITQPISFWLVFMYSVPIALIHLPGFIVWDRYKTHKMSVMLFPAFATVMEWLQYTFTPLGSWGAAAYTQAGNLNTIQVLSIFGLPGLSFLIYFANAVLAEIYNRPHKFKKLVLIPSMIILLAVVYGNIRVNSYYAKGKEVITIATVGTDSNIGGLPLPSKEESDHVKQALFERTKKAAKFGAKIIVWNEAATIVLPEDEQSWQSTLKFLAYESKTTLFASYIVPISTSPLKYENKYLLIDSAGTIKHEYYKHVPVPGEPAIKGDQKLEVFNIENANIGGVICYDYDFPYLAKEYGKINADIIAVPSSDWRGIDPLHTEMASFRAIEQGHSIIRSTRFGLSAAINPIGDLVSKSSSYDTNDKILISNIPSNGLTTVYANIGDIFIYLCIMFLIIFIIGIKKPRQ